MSFSPFHSFRHLELTHLGNHSGYCHRGSLNPSLDGRLRFRVPDTGQRLAPRLPSTIPGPNPHPTRPSLAPVHGARPTRANRPVAITRNHDCAAARTCPTTCTSSPQPTPSRHPSTTSRSQHNSLAQHRAPPARCQRGRDKTCPHHEAQGSG